MYQITKVYTFFTDTRYEQKMKETVLSSIFLNLASSLIIQSQFFIVETNILVHAISVKYQVLVVPPRYFCQEKENDERAKQEVILLIIASVYISCRLLKVAF